MQVSDQLRLLRETPVFDELGGGIDLPFDDAGARAAGECVEFNSTQTPGGSWTTGKLNKVLRLLPGQALLPATLAITAYHDLYHRRISSHERCHPLGWNHHRHVLLDQTPQPAFESEGLMAADELAPPLHRVNFPWIHIFFSLLTYWTAGILMFGVSLQKDTRACAVAIYLCVSFYTSSKVLIYAFLSEKVYMVWDTGRSRLRSPVYVLCMVTVAVYGAIVGLMAIGGIAELRQTDGVCVIGLKPTASIPLLSYDLYINILLTSLFLWPLFRSQHSTARLRRVAARTLIASAVALTTSTINMTILTVLHGRELGWICLASCGTDVVFNASALFWVTSGTSQSSLSGTSSVRHEATNLKPNLIAFPAPPSPGRSHFKVDAPLSPSQGAFAKEDKQTYEMGSLSPTAARFQVQFLLIRCRFFSLTGRQIQVTTESRVVSGPSDVVNPEK
ncbi:hypothetical protein FB45DRAFT_1106524 [Roridomyces roridus]|uniref:Transmembrane protein n=1 Tax=Roridomyces roridus TaxID=1738132 RepID=A0AAD7BBF7_9AGAR|nr:hypothetical protein FB45DRAFT_1106524 [Roridomyces roridus]